MEKHNGNFQNPYTYLSFAEPEDDLATGIIRFLSLQELPITLSNRNLSEQYGVSNTSTISGCDIFMFLMSSAYKQSQQYTEELELAKRLKKYIIPISVQGVLYTEFEHVQIGDAGQLYILAVELAERIRELLSPDKAPSISLKRQRIEFILILLHENSPFRINPIIYDGKKLVADHSAVLAERLDDLDELDWMEYFVMIEVVFPTERHARSKYNGVNFPTVRDIANHLIQTLAWEDIKKAELTSLIKTMHYES